MIKIYINFFIVIFKILYNFKEYHSFLYRPSNSGRGFGLLNRSIQQRMKNETASEKQNIQSRENTFLYLSLLAFSEKTNDAEMKEELFTLISVLLMWYCEPLSEHERPTE